MSADSIAITGISQFGYHGVLDSEREHGQEFFVDVELRFDLAAAAANDDLQLTVNYAEVAERVAEIVAGPAVQLIETLAERIAAALMLFPVEAVKVTVHKPSAPISVKFTDVSVTVQRERGQ